MIPVTILILIVLGGIWYGPLFGQAWLSANGMTADQMKANFSPARSYGITFLINLITAHLFAMFLGSGVGWAAGVQYGLVAGVVWVAGSYAITYQFESRPTSLLIINGGYHAVRFGLFGLIIGAMN